MKISGIEPSARPLSSARSLSPGKESEIRDAIRSSTILIVDDHKLIRDMISVILSKAGFTNLYYAEDGLLALDRADRINPDMVILDQNMPNMSGIEVCRKLRADPRWRDLTVLFQTASSTEDERVRAFEVGATDLVSKPINPRELGARVRLHLANRTMIRRLSEYQARTSEELNAAHFMQEGLLPDDKTIEAAARRHGLIIGSHYSACSELGGDIWNLRSLDDERLAFYLADFSGHGVGAALNTFRLQTYMDRTDLDLADPSACLFDVNNYLSEVLPAGQFATMIYGILDRCENRLTYASAGAPPPVICRGMGNTGPEWALLESAGLPVGMKNGTGYELREAAFAPGAFLLLYSDALIETPSPADPIFTEDLLGEFVASKSRIAPGAELLQAVNTHLFETNDQLLSDDLTMVFIGSPEPVRLETGE